MTILGRSVGFGLYQSNMATVGSDAGPGGKVDRAGYGVEKAVHILGLDVHFDDSEEETI